jgi:MoaA/NifB/PqqE/SkfB family radical SAM enzyme
MFNRIKVENLLCICKYNFVDVWNNRFQPFRNRNWAKKGVCADCSMFYCEGNGMHLHDDEGNLLVCHYNRIVGKGKYQ